MEFLLTKEHVKLLKEINVKTSFFTWYGDEIIPQIDEKRPFGNSSVTHDVMQRLHMLGKNGEYSSEDETRALTILAELPLAFAVVMKSEDFTPRALFVDEKEFFVEIHQVQVGKNIIAHMPFLTECQKTVQEDVFCDLISLLYSNYSDNPGEPVESFLGIAVQLWQESNFKGNGEEEQGRIANWIKVWDFYLQWKENSRLA